jgi:hypothetical protein
MRITTIESKWLAMLRSICNDFMVTQRFVCKCGNMFKFIGDNGYLYLYSVMHTESEPPRLWNLRTSMNRVNTDLHIPIGSYTGIWNTLSQVITLQTNRRYLYLNAVQNVKIPTSDYECITQVMTMLRKGLSN